MRPLKRPLAALFALAYLSASWLAAALHSHAGHEHVSSRSEAECPSSHCCHHHGHSHSHGDSHSYRHDHDGEPAGHSGDHSHGPCQHDEHHHCVVCEFLAKPPLLVEPLNLPEGTLPVAPAVEPALPTVDLAVASAWWSRGPPVA